MSSIAFNISAPFNKNGTRSRSDVVTCALSDSFQIVCYIAHNIISHRSNCKLALILLRLIDFSRFSREISSFIFVSFSIVKGKQSCDLARLAETGSHH